jgi:hypothetical protein
MQKSASLFRVFHFICDDLPYSIAVDHAHDLAGPDQERYLTNQFYSLLEAVLPGRRAAGQITGITCFDDAHPSPDSVNREAARLDYRTGLAHHAVAEWRKAVCS